MLNNYKEYVAKLYFLLLEVGLWKISSWIPSLGANILLNEALLKSLTYSGGLAGNISRLRNIPADQAAWPDSMSTHNHVCTRTHAQMWVRLQ